MKFPIEIGWYGRVKNEPRKFCITWSETGKRGSEDVIYDNITEVLLALNDWIQETKNTPEELELFLHWQDMMHEEFERDVPDTGIDIIIFPEGGKPEDGINLRNFPPNGDTPSNIKDEDEDEDD